MGLRQLESLEKFVKRRREIARFYDNSLESLSNVKIITPPSPKEHNYFKYLLVVEGISREFIHKKMEEEGIITSKISVLNNDKINLSITVFLSISVASHQEEWVKKFNNTIMKYDQILEVYRLASSTADYLLKIVAPSIESYDQFQQKLINEIDFRNMTSNISLKVLKKNNYLPLDFI